MAWTKVYFRIKWHLHPSSRLATIVMGRNWGPRTFQAAEMGPHLSQRRWAQAFLRTKWRLDPSSRLARIDMGRKLGAPPPFRGGGAGSPSNTMSLGLRPNSLPSGILIHPAIWAQYTNVTDRQDRHNRPTDNGLTAYGEPSYKRMPINGSPYAIGPLSACLSVCLSVCLSCPVWNSGSR